MDLSKIKPEQFEHLKEQFIALIKQAGETLLEGGQEDMALFAEGIATDMVASLQIADDARRDALLKEQTAQWVALAEVQRIRLVHESWDLFYAVVKTGVGGAVAVLKAL